LLLVVVVVVVVACFVCWHIYCHWFDAVVRMA